MDKIPVKSTNLGLNRMLGALRDVERPEEVKLPALVRLAIASNINALMPLVQTFDRAMSGKRREIRPGEDNLQANNAILAELEALGDAEMSVDLHPIEMKNLKLESNPRITGEMISALDPILKRDAGE